jgi:hypothetical protein
MDYTNVNTKLVKLVDGTNRFVKWRLQPSDLYGDCLGLGLRCYVSSF